jgi:hypothetical protein
MMDELKESITTALGSEGRIPRQLVRKWIHDACSVEIEALLYKLTGEAWSRIEPNLEQEETCALIQRYLLRCIRENPSEGAALNRYDAAGELERWFDHLAGIEDTGDILQGVAAGVAALFLNGDDLIRGAIETGFLEHVLEQPALRHLFSDWAYDERLQAAWRRALAWGEAHPSLMKSLRAGVRTVEGDEE